MNHIAENPQLVRVAVYVRMSTEHQQYSTHNQMDTLKDYAASHGMKIVRIYSDESKSGLNIQGRDSLGTMISDVQNGAADFSAILVYDISRWGRFQDADESAYYEYICRRAGIQVHYCAEQFENDGSPTSTIVKGVKRAMAGEYSRELSSKVFQGACRLIQMGYKQGGTAGYGLRRMLVSQNGERKGTLKIGEHKSLQTDRVILVPGPEDEIANVRWIYEAFVRHGLLESEIARALNARNVMTDFGRPWTRGSVHQILTNEKYIGNNVYYRTSFKLKKKLVRNPADRWIRAERVFEGIIEPSLFFQTQGIIIERCRRFSNEEMLDKLRKIFQQYGRISGILIDEYEEMPSSAAFRHRFGSLITAYKLIGYTPEVDYSFIEINRYLRRQHPAIVANVVAEIEALGGSVVLHDPTELLVVNGEFRTSIVICRHQSTFRGASRWAIRLDESLRPDITIAARMDHHNKDIFDYYLLPSVDITWGKLRIAEENGIYLDAYRFQNLDYFFHMAARTTLEGVA